ncbi:hypothetical protein [Adhaeribacter aquaticus]|uniref:hypothetical protein n=1 Tax=Adhaeribacter aquaticus TaxID=299567 RepID=UPI000479D423|nr:hypothetical protein [Adhaeribacter aquaticus]
MLEVIKKMWCDTTKNTLTGEYSMKRLQVFLFTWLSVVFSLPYLIEVDLPAKSPIKIIKPPIELILIFLGIALGSSYLTILGKFQNRKRGDENGVPLSPAYPEHTTNH